MTANKILIAIAIIVLASLIMIPNLTKAYGREVANLSEGKNLLQINATLYVSDLILLNPDITTISYFDEQRQETIGFVKAMGGVGSNFLIIPGREYEIYASGNLTLLVP